MEQKVSQEPGAQRDNFLRNMGAGLIRATIAWVLVSYALTPAHAADDPTAAAQASLKRLEAMRKERPKNGDLIFHQALLEIILGEHESGFKLLQSLQGRKLGLIPVFDTGFDPVWGDERFQAIRRGLEAEEAQTPVSPVAFRLKDPKLIPEGIAYDPNGNRFFLGSIAEKKIIVTDLKGQERDFSSPNDKLDPVLGLTVDAAHGCLCAVSTNGFEESAKQERRNAVVRYDLKSGGLIDRIAAPEAMQLNDLTVAPDGTIYVTDSETGTLFRKKPNETTLTRFGATAAVRGANGIALGADGTLYVTLSSGIARINTDTGEPKRLPQPDTVATGAIDGLYWYDGDLFGVQNSTNPGRVIRIGLTDKGTRITGLTVLQSHHHPDFDEPTTGAIANGALNVIGNSYIGHYRPDGTIIVPDVLRGTAIVAVPLHR